MEIGGNILLTDFRWRDILPKSQKNVESLFWNFELLLYQRKQAGELPLVILQNAKKLNTCCFFLEFSLVESY